MFQLNIYKTDNTFLGNIDIEKTSTVKDIKREIESISNISESRQSIRFEENGIQQNDNTVLENSKIEYTKTVFVKDLGPQIGWKDVFLLEYCGPLVIYNLFVFTPWVFNLKNIPTTFSAIQWICEVCWSLHYIKRIYETLYVHRFSHTTMPLKNLFRNCGYYWGFAYILGYHVNHGDFTPPPLLQALFGLLIFIVCEIGNLSVHLLFRDLRPTGSKMRKIPVPNDCPLTKLFNLVSCPNYTYEFGSWFGFAMMTSCFYAGVFALAGLYQMTMWAISKHKRYKLEFPNYPENRKAIIPFLI